MKTLSVSRLYTYPFKSMGAISINRAEVLPEGLNWDRFFALVDENNTAVTGRSHPKLVKIKIRETADHFILTAKDQDDLYIHKSMPELPSEKILLFNDQYAVSPSTAEAAKWFSDYLGEKVKLISSTKNPLRKIKEKHGGDGNKGVHLADAAPILMVSESSIDDLNSRLDKPITPLHFRPNIVISGTLPWEEDAWKSLMIGDIPFSVGSTCQRCVFTTVDPDTGLKNENQEPLRTLSNFRNERNEEVSFGIYLIPKALGVIKTSDRLSFQQARF